MCFFSVLKRWDSKRTRYLCNMTKYVNLVAGGPLNEACGPPAASLTCLEKVSSGPECNFCCTLGEAGDLVPY